MKIAEWIIWGFYVFITIFLFAMWLYKEKQHKTGQYYDTEVVMALIGTPRFCFWASLVLIVFLFINLNKLHLIWIYPVLYFYISVRMAKHLKKKRRIREKQD